MGKYKLTYFNSRGFAEVSRIILKLKEQDFEDVRVDSETWPKMKQDTPQGKLPVLEVDGKKIPQSSAIYRYLAGEFDTPQGKLPVLEVDGRKIPQSAAIYRYLAREFGMY
ncbi:hypothetical protein FSP39_022790 [Pinctada imbricata]|uniref:GST N-terminal domain-containing protein n=1 Tax=Pinctada imbricata TaxID=66713 RepID=A0AA89C002_PINIB|nr:hypothetical protein FSP39_022790 [Pinctada imbricata]